MCIKMDFKKIASGAGTLFSRAKQYTEEMLGQAEKTELDAHLENLLQRADKTKQWTERILKQTESVLQPNPNVRLEEFLYEKVQGKKPPRLVENDILGQSMIDAGNDFGPGTGYGSTLIRCGQTQQKLGQAQRDFIQSAHANFLQPFSSFLEGDMKTIQRERKLLDLKRLDLDSAKTKLKRAKSQTAKEAAEAELRQAQTDFDRQAEVTKLLLEGVSSAHAHHLRCLHDFIEAQMTFYAQCNLYMNDLQRQLGSYGLSMGNSVPLQNMDSTTRNYGDSSASTVAPSAPPASDAGGSRAKVLYDYDAADMTELSLAADEDAIVFDK